MWRSSLLGVDARLNLSNFQEASVQRPPLRAPLQGRLQADVVVVGAGFAGLSAALELAERGLRVVVLEARRVGSGATGRNGGQVIVGYASGLAPFEKQFGAETALQAWNMSLQAIDLLDQRIASHKILCERVHGYLNVADSPRKTLELRRAFESLLTRGIEGNWAEGADVGALIDSPRYKAAFYERRSGHLHPLKYALGLARAARSAGVQIFELSPVTALQRGDPLVARTPEGEVQARYGVLAGNSMLAQHAPRVAPELSARIMPVGTYIAGTVPLDPALCARLVPSNAAVADNNFALDYFRFTEDHRLLLGGRVSYTGRTPGGLESKMRERMEAIFPQLRATPIDHIWGGFVDISMNRAPDFGRLSDNLYYLQGFSGHGVALTGLAGMLAAQAVAGQAEHFDLFARLQHRPFPGGAFLRTPTLVLGMWWYRLREILG
jgi:gamma-glutamylputrescine oxidase